MSDDAVAFSTWLGSSAVLIPLGFFVAAKMPRTPLLGPIRVIVRAIPLAWLFTPSIAFGFIAFPVPAGVIIVGALMLKIRGQNPVQGPNLASLPLAEFMLVSVAIILTALFYVPSLIKYFVERGGRKNA